MGQKFAAGDVVGLLRERYPANGWALLEQVANGTGAKARRWADVVVMSLWPSRGLEIDGFEVKVSRGDWVSELKNPEKADEVARYCDRWWLAVGDESIVRPGELPSQWGLMVQRNGKLVVDVEAPKLTPEPLSRSFLASVLRRAQGVLSLEAAILGAVDERHDETRRVAREEGMGRYRELAKRVQDFEDASGLKIADGWPCPSKVGEIAKKYLGSGLSDMKGQIVMAQMTFENLAETLKRDLAKLSKAEQ